MDPMQSGIEAFQAGRYMDAVRCFMLALEAGQDPAQCWTRIGAACAQQMAWPAAEDAFRRALEHSPGSTRAYYNLALCCERQGNLQEASSLLSTAIRIDPAYTAASDLLKSVLGRMDVILTDDPTAAVIEPGTPLIVVISRESIENRDLCDIRTMLDLWTQNPEWAQSSRAVCTLSIHGYDDDHREISEIPEVREWWSLLEEECGYIFWFLDPECYVPFSACALSVEFSGGQVCVDVGEVRRYLHEKSCWMAAMAAHLDVDASPVVCGLYEALALPFDQKTDAEIRHMATVVRKAISSRIGRETSPLHLQVVQNRLAIQCAAIEQTGKKLEDEGAALTQRAVSLLGNRAERCRAARILCKRGDPRHIASVLASLGQMTWAEAMELAEYLPRFGEAVAAPLGRCALISDRKQTITACILGLKYLASPGCALALAPLLDDRYGLDTAGEALAACGRPAFPILVGKLNHPKADVRTTAAKALALIRDQAAIPALEAAAASDRSKVVRAMARRAVDTLRGAADDDRMVRTTFDQYLYEAVKLIRNGEFEDAKLQLTMAQPFTRPTDWRSLALHAICAAGTAENGMGEPGAVSEQLMQEARSRCPDQSAWDEYFEDLEL